MCWERAAVQNQVSRRASLRGGVTFSKDLAEARKGVRVGRAFQKNGAASVEALWSLVGIGSSRGWRNKERILADVVRR